MATIKDVAERANVAKSTVSYAFNKPHKVNPDTLARIFEAAKALDYQPNVFAQGLAGGKTQMVGLLVPDIRYPFNATISRGIEDRLREAGYLAITASTDGESAQTAKLMGQLQRRGVSSFIIVPSFFGVNEDLVEASIAMQTRDVPVVIAGFNVGDDRLEQVTFEAQAGGRELVSHLVALGHQDIAYIGGHSDGTDRFLGYKAGLAEHNIALRPELVVQTGINKAQLYLALERLLALPKPPTALFAMNDVAAYAVLDYCAQHTIHIPNDLSLATFDYQALVQRESPGITSVVVPLYEVGRQSAELLLNRFQTPDLPVQQISLPYTFAVRETTGQA